MASSIPGNVSRRRYPSGFLPLLTQPTIEGIPRSTLRLAEIQDRRQQSLGRGDLADKGIRPGSQCGTPRVWPSAEDDHEQFGAGCA